MSSIESTSTGNTFTEADQQAAIEKYGRDIYTDFDFNDPEWNNQFYDVVDELVAKCPVARGRAGTGYWVINQQQLIRELGQDWKSFSNAKGYQPNRPEGLPYLYPEESDPPIHTAWRRMLNRFMAPKAVAPYEATIRSDCNALIDQFIDRGECEFVSEFGAKLPGWAFFKNVMGVPIDDLDKLVDGVEQGTFGQPPEARAAHFAYVFQYLGEYLAERAKGPDRGEMVDAIARGVEYEDGTLSPWEDRVSVLVDMCFGGIATTTYVMSAGLHFLAQNPAQRRRLLSDPALYPRAVEEFARAFTPVPMMGRVATKDAVVAGVPVAEGDFVMLNYAASNRDPRAVEDPTAIDVGRETVLHSTFGVGVHRCIGSNLARLELVAVLDEWLKRIPNFAIKEGTEPEYETTFLRTMKNLWFTW
jgi:cytochrome P450